MELKKHKEITLVLTYDCNLRCAYCYEPKKAHKHMTLETAKEIILKEQQIINPDKINGIQLQFMGGEPLMRFGIIRDLCEWIWKQDFKIPIVDITFPTNGTLLNPEKKQWLVFHRDKIKPMLSFDGNRLMQNINRSNSASQVELDFFAKNWPNVAVKMTVSPDTINSLYDGIMYLYENGFTRVESNLAYGRNLKWGKEHLHILSEELDKLINFYISHSEIPPMGMVTMPVWMILDPECKPMRCQLGDNLICYDCDGKSYPCHLFSPLTLEGEKLEKARSINFLELYKSDNDRCRKCILRPICLTCYGSNYLDTGDCNNQSAFNCAQFKLYFLASCKYHKANAIMTRDNYRLEAVNRVLMLLNPKNNL